MKFPETLATKDPSAFRNQPLRLSHNGYALSVKAEGDTVDFGATMGLRAQENASIGDYLTPGGVTLANMGVSSKLITLIDEKFYAILALQERADMDGAGAQATAKLISGYLGAEHFKRPDVANELEITDELLVVTDKGLAHGYIDEGPLAKSFADVVQYDGGRYDVLTLPSASGYELPATQGIEKVDIEGKEIPGATLYVHGPTNSCQLVFSQIVSLPEGLEELVHTEDKFNDGKLDVKVVEPGLVLAELNGPHLSGAFYTFSGGELRPYSVPVQLSEAFVQHDEKGVVRDSNIALEEYLSNL